MFFDKRSRCLDGTPDDFGQMDPLLPQRDAALRDSGYVEEIVKQPPELVSLAAGDLQSGLAAVVVGLRGHDLMLYRRERRGPPRAPQPQEPLPPRACPSRPPP